MRRRYVTVWTGYAFLHPMNKDPQDLVSISRRLIGERPALLAKSKELSRVRTATARIAERGARPPLCRHLVRGEGDRAGSH